MATETNYLKLSKAERTDVVLNTLDANNSNFDILDAKIAEIDNKEVDLSNYYTKTQVDSSLSNKANTSELSKYLPLAGGTLNAGAKLTFIPGDPNNTRKFVLEENGIKLYSSTGSVWANGVYFMKNDDSNTIMGGFGGYGGGNSLTHLYIGATYNEPWCKFTSDGTVTATKFSGSGASLTSLNASNLSSGTVPAGRLPVATTSTAGIVKAGTNLTIDSDGTLHASTSSAVSSEALKVLIKRSSSTSYYPVLLTNTGDGTTEKQDNVYASSNNTVTLNPGDGALKATKFEGSGASLTSLNASNVSSGTLSSDRLPTVPITKGGTGATTAAAALTNLGITATATELNILDGVTATTAELNYVDGVTSNIQTQLNGKLATNGSGASLTSLNASNISSGTLNAARLPSIAASKITAGTFAGMVYANATGAANIGTAQMRSIQAGTSEPTAGSTALTTGTIWLVYE